MSETLSPVFSNTYFHLYDVTFPLNYPAHKKPAHRFIPSEKELSMLMEKREDTRNLKHYVEFTFFKEGTEEVEVIFNFAYDPKTSRVYIPDQFFQATMLANLKTAIEETEVAFIILHNFLAHCVKTVHINYVLPAAIDIVSINCVVTKDGVVFDQKEKAENNSDQEKQSNKDGLFGWDN